MSSAIASSYGLAFSISPAKPKHKSKNPEDDDEDYSLTLAPFTKAPKISFGSVKLNTLVERNLLIINPQQFEVKLNVVSQELSIDNMELSIEKNSNVNFKIKWQPDRPDSYKYTIFFEVINNAKLKFLVHCYGHCIAPPAKKPARKPFTTLQPLKKEKSAKFGDDVQKTEKTTTQKPVTGALKPATKENKIQPKASTVLNSKRVPLKFEATVVPKKASAKTPTLESRTVNLTTTMEPETTNQTFLVHSIYNKPKKPARSDIYNTSFECEMAEEPQQLPDMMSGLPKSSTMYDIRRQTCIIGSPRINKEGKFVTIAVDEGKDKTPKLRRSLSANNLGCSPSNFFNDNSLFVVANGGTGVGNATAFGSYDLIDSTHILPSTQNGIPNKHSPTVSSTLMANKNLSPLMSLKQKTFTPQHLNIKALTNLSNSDTPKLTDFLPGPTNNKAPQIIEPSIKSEAQASLVTQLDYGNTPCLKEPMPNKYLELQTPCQLYTTCYDDAEESFQTMQNLVREEDLLHAVLMVQRKWRMKVFRRRLRVLKFQRAQEIIDMEIARVAKEKEEQQYLERLCVVVLKVQRHWRLKQFRRALVQLREIKRKQEEAYRLRLVQAALFVQRVFRYRQFQRALVKLKVEHEKMVQMVCVCQRAIRIKRFRKALRELKEKKRQEEEEARLAFEAAQEQKRREEEEARLALEALKERSARLIQHQWAMFKFRKAMRHYRTAAVVIQRWVRNKHDRFVFLQLRRAAITLQRVYKARFEFRVQQAVVIQKNWRMWRQMTNFSYQMHQIIKLQRWIRSKSIQFKIMALKRSIPRIQHKAREYINKRNKAALVIQRQFRMHLFRKRMTRYRKAALVIQQFHRSMSERYLYLRKRTIIYQIQCLYRRVYMVRRHSAALKIQCFWRVRLAQREYQKRRIEWEAEEEIRQREMFINNQATRIQAWWRGYLVRKETDQILNKIRDRLSIYVAKTQEQNTLGMRIRNSLAILGLPNVSIQQIIIALIDLEKVTRLSPECCSQFTREGAHDILYTFMQNCNRSVPHMDLVKICLQIFINLAKYTETVCQVLEPSYSLAVLSNLIQSYQSSNPAIFMDVCVLFILLVQSKPLSDHLNNQECFIKKLQSLHTILERRHLIKMKGSNTAIAQAQIASMNSTMSGTPSLYSIPKKGQIGVLFTMSPEWSLKQKSMIELPDQLTALEFLLNSLGINFKENNGTKTPVKPRNPFYRENMSSSKSSTSIVSKQQMRVTQSARAPMTKSQSVNFNQNSRKLNLKNNIEEVEQDIDETCMSVHGGHDDNKSIVSTASFLEEPKMNSTIIVQTKQETAYDRRATVTISKSTVASQVKVASAPPRRKIL